jgi:hypothetical protein
MAKVKGTKKRTRAKHKKPGSKRGRGVKHYTDIIRLLSGLTIFVYGLNPLVRFINILFK